MSLNKNTKLTESRMQQFILKFGIFLHIELSEIDINSKSKTFSDKTIIVSLLDKEIYFDDYLDDLEDEHLSHISIICLREALGEAEAW